jgi:sec-independent protein translocase protein TatB
MFDVGPSELIVIAVVALVVLGPTRLPGLVRKVGRWVGKARAMARDFREQLESEVNVDELNRAAKKHLNLDDDSIKPFDPSRPAEPASSTTAGVAAAGTGATASGDALADAPAPDLTYPYGTPTDTSSSSADPHVVQNGLQPGDDEYSHAHAAGAEPEPWTPEGAHESPHLHTSPQSHESPVQTELALAEPRPAATDLDGPDKQAT